jgi:ABC-2 type transport system permease protein
MRKTLAVLEKELEAYFVSPIAYAVMMVFLLLSGFFFYNILSYFNFQCLQYSQYPYALEQLNLNEMVMRPLFHNMAIIILLMAPLLTMRLFAEEKRSGTIELLMTSPVTHWQVTLGKYGACLLVYALMLATTFLYTVILVMYGEPDLGPILSGYLGLFLMGAAFLSIGLLASSTTENQIVAAVISFGALLLFYVIGWMSSSVGVTLGKVLSYLSIVEHLDDFVKGVIDTKDIVYYVSFVFMGIYMSIRSAESSAWR